MSPPTSADFGRWVLISPDGLDSLEYTATPVSFQLGPDDVLVRLHAASLNAKDIAIVKGISKAAAFKPIIPASDGAGVVLETGPAVTEFRAGDKVVTHIPFHIADDALPSMADLGQGLGSGTDGTLRRLGVFKQTALVQMPKDLSFAEAATLTCSGLTAWNALMCSLGRPLKPGDYVLVQGTGGVSIAALQIAVAAGATVVATTSTTEKAVRLQTLGAKYVVNYRTEPNWGEAAQAFTPDGRGFDFVIDIGGYATLDQSMSASRLDGIIAVTGASGGFNVAKPDIFQVLAKGVILRGILTGNRRMFKDLVKFINRHALKPAVDDINFELQDVKEAYKRLEAKKHFSKIIINLQ